MENKKNTNSVIAIIILILCVLSLGGYIVYDKVLSEKSNNTEIKEEQPKVEQTQKEETTKELTIEERYQNYLTNYKKNKEEMYNEYSGHSVSFESMVLEDTNISFKIKSNGDLIVSMWGEEAPKKYENYKVDNNVLTMAVSSFGNGGYKGLWYLKEDGKVYSITPEIAVRENKNMEIKTTNYKNIVEIKESNFGDGVSGAWGPVFVDIEGNMFK